jgi:hypothetical protein
MKVAMAWIESPQSWPRQNNCIVAKASYSNREKLRLCRDLCHEARSESPIKPKRLKDQNVNKGVDCRRFGAVADLLAKERHAKMRSFRRIAI